MRKRMTLSVAFFVLAAVAATGQAPDLGAMDLVQRSVPDGPVAMVEGSPIGRDDFMLLYENRISAVKVMSREAEPGDATRVKVALAVLVELVQREILAVEADKRGYKVPEGDLEAAYQARLDNLRAQLAQYAGEQPTEAQILEQSGQTRVDALESLRKSLLVDRTREAIAQESGVAVTKAEIQEFYDARPELFQRPEGLHLKQVFVMPKPGPREADTESWARAQGKVEKALARLRAGESFEAVAKSVSESPDARQGGDMGMMPANQLPPFFLEAAAAMKPGGLSDVIVSDIGVHIVQLVGKESADKISLDRARDRIEELLAGAKTEEAIVKYCEPIMADPSRVGFYLQLDETLANRADLEPPKAQ